MTAFPSELGESAIALAAEQPVIPLEPAERGGKRPLGGLGLRSATRDRETVASWWRRWPDANIGLRCDGLLVFDVDGQAGQQSLAELEEQYGPLPASRVVLTGKGEHRYFRCSIPAGNSTRGLGHPAGLDLRGGARGYVCAPPSRHTSGRRYEWANAKPIAELPANWLRPLTAISRSAPTAPEDHFHLHGPSTETGYGRRALESELERLLQAQPGERNEQLNLSVFRLAQLVAGGQLAESRVESSARMAALMLGLEAFETAATIRSALNAGRCFPRLPSRVRARAAMRGVSIDRNDRNDSSTAGESSQLAGTVDRNLSVDSNALDGTNERRTSDYRARASEKSPLVLFARTERTLRRRRRRRQPPTAHLRYGRLDPEIEKSLELERPPLSDPDEAEVERLCVKHVDLKELK